MSKKFSRAIRAAPKEKFLEAMKWKLVWDSNVVRLRSTHATGDRITIECGMVIAPD